MMLTVSTLLCLAVGISAYCGPSDSCWPSQSQWDDLNTAVEGNLITIGTPTTSQNALTRADDPAAVQWTQFQDDIPIYAVDCYNAKHVAIAIQFAANHTLRTSVKSTGHDFNGRSTQQDSLLIWVHHVKGVEWNDAFDDGCGGAKVKSFSVGGGDMWKDIYNVQSSHGTAAVGGNEITVSTAGGYLQGGGHACNSPNEGLAVDHLLQVEVVTADGVIRIASACSEPDLFWALRGGGGGTFGVVTRAVYSAPAKPDKVTGLNVVFPMTAYNANALAFLQEYINLVPTLEKRWGGYFLIGGGDIIPGVFQKSALVHLVFQGSQSEASASIASFKSWFDAHSAFGATWQIKEYSDFWSWHGSSSEKTGAAESTFSRLIPGANFDGGAQAAALAQTIYNGAVKNNINYFIIQLGGQTSLNDLDSKLTSVTPALRKAQWHVVGYTKTEDAAVGEAMINELRAQTPGSGAYWNEMDYNEPDWQKSFWGETNYARLLAIKQAVDPNYVFNCHHCVGSENAPSDHKPSTYFGSGHRYNATKGY